jgi:ribonuclease P protein subunit POP4
MVMRNPSNILKHELIGLFCEIVSSSNKSQIGLKGKIIDETMKTVVIQDEEERRIPKQNTVFRIELGGKKIDIDGNYLIARPEDRIKRKFKKW